jgi:glutamate synthase domain-containing protein 2
MKICNDCGVEKELKDFYKAKSNTRGYENSCKKCRQERRKKKKKEWLNKNKNKVKKYKKIYYENHKVEICKKSRNYRNNNLEKCQEKEKEKRQTESYKLHRKFYMKKHKEENKHVYAWRSTLRNTITRMNTIKSDKTINMLGYSANELKYHIEKLFTPEMTWENYGEWHIDHIKSVSTFDKDTPVNVVCALDNLQPLWSTTREINGVIYEGNLNKFIS